MKLTKLVGVLALFGMLGLAGCDDDEVLVVTPVGAAVDNLFITWEIQSLTIGPAACETVGAERVDMAVFNIDTGLEQVFSFPCVDYQGLSGDIGIGRFNVGLSLVDLTGRLLSAVDVGVANLTVSGTLDLGHVIFQVP